MITQKIRDLVSPLELDPEVKTRIEELLQPFAPEAEVPEDIRDKVLELLDLEVETNELLAQAYENTAQNVDQFISEAEQAAAPSDPTSTNS